MHFLILEGHSTCISKWNAKSEHHLEHSFHLWTEKWRNDQDTLQQRRETHLLHSVHWTDKQSWIRTFVDHQRGEILHQEEIPQQDEWLWIVRWKQTVGWDKEAGRLSRCHGEEGAKGACVSSDHFRSCTFSQRSRYPRLRRCHLRREPK